MRLKSSHLIFLGFIIFCIWYATQSTSPNLRNNPYPNKSSISKNTSNNVDPNFNLDTIKTFEGDHPNKKVRMEDNHAINNESSKPVKWLRPAGKDFIYRKTPEMERLWKEVQEKESNRHAP